jgi:hypothetical protein
VNQLRHIPNKLANIEIINVSKSVAKQSIFKFGAVMYSLDIFHLSYFILSLIVKFFIYVTYEEPFQVLHTNPDKLCIKLKAFIS